MQNFLQHGERHDVVFKVSRYTAASEAVAVVEQNVVRRFFVDVLFRPLCDYRRGKHDVRFFKASRVNAVGVGVRSGRKESLGRFDADLTVTVQTDDFSVADIHARVFQQQPQIALHNTADDGLDIGRTQGFITFFAEVFPQHDHKSAAFVQRFSPFEQHFTAFCAFLKKKDFLNPQIMYYSKNTRPNRRGF